MLLERQFDSQSAVKQAVPLAKAITTSNIKNIKFKIKNNKLNQLQGMSAKTAAYEIRTHACTNQ